MKYKILLNENVKYTEVKTYGRSGLAQKHTCFRASWKSLEGLVLLSSKD